MGSFVPFGGFFPSTSDFESTWSKKKQSTGCCNICNEKYEQEAAIVLKGGATVSVADQYSSNLSSWLQMAESDKGKHLGTKEASDDQIVLNARLMGLQKKWNEICQRLHHFSSIQQTVSSAKSQVSNIDAFQFTSARSESGNTSLLLDERKLADPNSCLPSDLQHVPLLTPNVLKPVPSLAGVDSRADVPVQGLRIGNFWNSYGVSNFSLPLDHTTASSITSVTTDLGLGTIYASAGEEPSKTKFQERKTCLPKFSQGSVSADTSCGNVSNQIGQSYSSPVPQSGNQSDRNDFKYLLKVLSEKVSWQDGAVYTISQTVTSCKNGLGRRHSSSKGNMWLIFHGPDKVGKRRIAASLADAIFGNKQNLFQVDFGSVENVSRSNTLFDRQDLKSNDRNFRGKTMVDYVAEELSKKPQSLVVLLENIDKADLLVQHSLSRAMRTGRFPDSHGREISISNVIFVFTSRDTRVNKDVHSEKPATEYSEERILSARDFQMQLSIGRASGDGAKSNTNATTASTKEHTTLISVGKRKSIDDIEFSTSKMLQKPKRAREVSRSCLDLNLPVEGMEEEDDNDYDDNDDNDYSGSENSKAWLEDLFDQVDENISFKPFDFDSLSQNILKDISLRFQQTVESNWSLEIDSEVMVQILAAAWLSDRKQSVDDWIENVLCRSFKEIQQRYHLSQNHVLKLIPCENLVENHAPGICLPAKVNVN